MRGVRKPAGRDFSKARWPGANVRRTATANARHCPAAAITSRAALARPAPTARRALLMRRTLGLLPLRVTPPVNGLSAHVNERWARNLHLGGDEARPVRLDAPRGRVKPGDQPL